MAAPITVVDSALYSFGDVFETFTNTSAGAKHDNENGWEKTGDIPVGSCQTTDNAGATPPPVASTLFDATPPTAEEHTGASATPELLLPGDKVEEVASAAPTVRVTNDRWFFKKVGKKEKELEINTFLKSHPHEFILAPDVVCDGGILMKRCDFDLWAKPIKKSFLDTLLNQAFAAIVHLHEKGIIHGDLKPSNMMVSHDGHLKIIDFGASAFADKETGCAIRKHKTPHFLNKFGMNNCLMSYSDDFVALGRTIILLYFRFAHGRFPNLPKDGDYDDYFKSLWDKLNEIDRTKPIVPIPVAQFVHRTMQIGAPRTCLNDHLEIRRQLKYILFIGPQTLKFL